MVCAWLTLVWSAPFEFEISWAWEVLPVISGVFSALLAPALLNEVFCILATISVMLLSEAFRTV